MVNLLKFDNSLNLMTSKHGVVFNNLEKFWMNLRNFAYRNETIFEIFFICVYAYMQVYLVVAVFLSENAEQLKLTVSLFVIIILTIFAIHKLLIKSRNKLLEEDFKDVLFEKLEIEEKYKFVTLKFKELASSIEKYKKIKNK